jgi:glutamate dehydrogenase
MGPSFVLRAQEDTGATPAQITRAYSIAREAFGMRDCWAMIEALDNKIPAVSQYEMMYETSRLLRHSAYWLLRERRKALDIEARVKEFSAPLATLTHSIDKALAGVDRERRHKAWEKLRQSGAPERLADFMANIEALGATWDIAELAANSHNKIDTTASVWFHCGASLGLDWLRAEIERLPVDGQWQAIARTGLRDAAAKLHRHLSERALAWRGRGAIEQRIAGWLTSLGEPLAAWQRISQDMRSSGSADFATLSVGVDSLRKLAG